MTHLGRADRGTWCEDVSCKQLRCTRCHPERLGDFVCIRHAQSTRRTADSGKPAAHRPAGYAVQIGIVKQVLRSATGRDRASSSLPTLTETSDAFNSVRFLDETGTSPVVMSCGELLRRVAAHARLLLHPGKLRGRDTVDVRRRVVQQGERLFRQYKCMLKMLFPFTADESKIWFARLVANGQHEYISAIRRVRFVANATALAPGAVEFFLSGAKAIALWGADAESAHEEGPEHLLLYWWLLGYVMGGRIASIGLKLRHAVMLLALAWQARFPPVEGIKALMIHTAYDASRSAAAVKEREGQVHLLPPASDGEDDSSQQP